MAYTQQEKQRIDVGEKGDANTGDIIYDGGVKLNRTLDNLYNAFGDQRLYSIGSGDNLQKLFATGYYQKLPPSEYASKIELGSMHDLDTTTGDLVINLPTPKLGEQVKFINSNGTFQSNKAILRCDAGSSIRGSNELDLIHPYSHITLTCINDVGATKVWDYKIEPMFGDYSVPVDTSKVEIEANAKVTIDLFDKSTYSGAKLVLSAKELKSGQKEMTVSEILLMIDSDGNTIYSDEYSVLFKTKKIFNIDFKITGNRCLADVTASDSKINFAIKTIETIKAD